MASSLPPTGNGATAADAHDMLSKDAARGNATVHTFDPDASPEEKAAAAGKARSQLKSVKDTGDAAPKAGREVALDQGAGNVLPTITIEDVDKVNADADAKDDAPAPPGAMPAGAAPPIPDWYKVGWRAFTPPDTSNEDEDAGQARMLHSFISEQYYGDWYHNAALIVFAVVASHFLTRFHLGWGWLFIVLAVCNTYYTTSMARVRRRARDDIQRELTKTALMSETESAEWINEFLERFWLIYEPVLSATIVSSVDQILSTSTPAFLDGLRLSSFTLGTKAPRIDKVRTFPRTDADTVVMDWGFSFTPNDVSDMTPKEQARKVNPKIVLQIRVGKGGVVASFPVLVEDITFSGLMRIRLRLMNNFPHVQTVDLSFLEKPVIDYVLKPIGGETFGFDIANIPGLSSFIRDTTHSILGPMMYDPNVFTLNLEQLLSGAPVDSAIGVLKVTVRHARGMKGAKIGGGTPDPFVSISINSTKELAHTKYKNNTANPTWNETKFVLVNNLTDNLVFNILDYNDHRKNSELGSALFELSKLADDASQEDVMAKILKDGKDRGELHFDVEFFPVLKPTVNESGVEEQPESNIGIARFVLHQAKDLDTTKVHSADVNAFAKVYVGENLTNKSLTAKHTLQPVWECATEYLCTDRSSSIVTVKIIDDRDFLRDPCIGYISVRLEDLLESKKIAGRDWWPLSGAKSGRVRLSADWKPLNMAGSLHGADQYMPPIGVVRLWLKKATDVKNVEAALGGKSDPYVRVLVNGTVQARTEVVNNNLNPEWDQIIYTPIHSVRENLLLEVMDYQHLTKDRSLGTVELSVKDLAKEVPEGEGDPLLRYQSTGKREAADNIRLGRGQAFKGQLHYVAEFVPAWAISGVNFESGNPTLENASDMDSTGGDIDETSESSSDEERDAVPKGVTASKPLVENLPDIPVSAPEANVDGVPSPAEAKRGHRKAKSTDTTNTALSAVSDKSGSSRQTNGTRDTSPPEDEGAGVAVPKDRLLEQQAGVIVVHVKSAELAKKARLEVLLDDGYWPAFSTPRAPGTKAQWMYVGEGFVKELDFGRVILRLNEADEGDKDEILGEWKSDIKPFLQQAMDGASKFQLRNQDDKVVGTVELEARYVPVPVTLEPRESVNNMGVLRVTLIDGNGIRGVDRGGKSDPYAVFSLNGQKVFKSQTKKKTLTPSWNEDFMVNVPSRVGADFSVEVYDWNQIEQAKLLGEGKINLEDIEPFNGTERVITLSHTKHAEPGTIRISMLFQPEIIARSRKNTSTFSTAGRAMTQVGAAPLKLGKGAFHGVTGVFKRGGHDSSDDETPVNGRGDVPDLPGGQMSQPVGTGDRMVGATGATAVDSSGNPLNQHIAPPQDPGLLRVTVMNAKDLSAEDTPKPYVLVRVGDKETKTKHAGKTVAPEWNETLEFSCSASTPKLYAQIFDHHKLGKDKPLGEAEVDIWKHIQPVGESAADVFVELREGSGILKLRLAFDSDPKVGGSPRKSISSQFSSPSRFASVRKLRTGGSGDEE